MTTRRCNTTLPFYRATVKKEILSIGRPSILRHTNALSILMLLREAGSCSRADLVRASGLSAPTITNVVNDLLAQNLVEPLGEGESSGGRPPDMIRFKAEHGCILGVQISAISISLLLTDLNGAELSTKKIPLARKKTTPEAICGYIQEGLRSVLSERQKAQRQLLIMVVGVPAITNVEDGIVLSISTLDRWRSVPLRAMLSKIVDCLVIIENDTNLASQGEQYRGAAQTERDFVFINIGENVSAGIFLNGKIHHGSQWSAGEIAYLRLPQTSRRHPTIHQFGELEMVLTSSSILKSWHEGARKTARRTKKHPEEKEIDVSGVLNLAQAGDPRALEIVQHRAGMVSDIIINLSLILNPGLILLGGEVGGHPIMIDLVQRQLQGSEFAVMKIGAGTLEASGVLWGAISLALEATPSVLLPTPAP